MVGSRKKLLIIPLMALLLVLVMAGTASAGLGAKEAAEMVKTKIEMPVDIKEFKSDYSEYEGRGQWELRWKGKNEELNVSVDEETGNIVGLYRYERSRGPEGDSILPAVSKTEALEEAQGFLRKALPQLHKELKLSERGFQGSPPSGGIIREYNFTFERIVNGVPYPQDGVGIQISGKTGQVISYHFKWDHKSGFPPADEVISKEEAEKIMMDNGALELMYNSTNSPGEGEKPRVNLVHAVRNSHNVLVDAVTGEYTKKSYPLIGRDYGALGGVGAEDEKSREADNRLLPIEEEEIGKIANLLSKDEAQRYALKSFDLPEGFKLRGARLYQDYFEKDKRLWALDWNLEDSENNQEGQIGAEINAHNGELISYSKWIHSPDDGKKELRYSPNQAREIAEKFIKKLQPEKFKQIRLLEEAEEYRPLIQEEKSHNCRYIRIVNGLPFYDDGFRVSVDRATGEVTNYNLRWRSGDFPKPNNVLSPQKAFDILLGTNKLKMDYLKTQEPTASGRLIEEMGLFYHLAGSEPIMVDAFTGNLLKNSGEVYAVSHRKSFTDISGHPNEKDINTLFDLGVVGGSGDKFHPDLAVTNGDFIKMLVLASGWNPGEGERLEGFEDDTYGPYYQTAVHRGVLGAGDLPHPRLNMNRISASRLMLRGLELGKIAALEGIYKVPTGDVEEIPLEDRGFAALALKLDLLNSVNNDFFPEGEINRGSAAAAVVNYMRAFSR